jgi:signal peptidase I
MRKAVLGAFFTAIVLKLFLFDLVIAEGNSMEPAKKNGSILVVNRLKYGIRFPWQKTYMIRWAAPVSGEVVVFYTPEGDMAVKRCGDLIGADRFIALGDNSLQSYDSRSYGPAPVDNIIGKVLGIK